jgi:hypothetical protein
LKKKKIYFGVAALVISIGSYTALNFLSPKAHADSTFSNNLREKISLQASKDVAKKSTKPSIQTSEPKSTKIDLTKTYEPKAQTQYGVYTDKTPYMTVQSNYTIKDQEDGQMNLLSHNPNESEVVEAMGDMLNQKVEVSDRNGAVPMTQKHSELMSKIIEYSNFPDRDYLLAVTQSWVNGDFSNVVQEYNSLINIARGKADGYSKATSSRTKSQEQEFIKDRFGGN